MSRGGQKFRITTGGWIFRMGILLQGKPPKLGELLRGTMRG